MIFRMFPSVHIGCPSEVIKLFLVWTGSQKGPLLLHTTAWILPSLPIPFVGESSRNKQQQDLPIVCTISKAHFEENALWLLIWFVCNQWSFHCALKYVGDGLACKIRSYIMHTSIFRGDHRDIRLVCCKGVIVIGLRYATLQPSESKTIWYKVPSTAGIIFSDAALS